VSSEQAGQGEVQVLVSQPPPKVSEAPVSTITHWQVASAEAAIPKTPARTASRRVT
jgi:hypothetical protein